MPKPRTSLAELVETGAFRARRHHRRLLDDPVADEVVAGFQARYRVAKDELELRAIAREVERLMRDRIAEAERAVEAELGCQCPGCRAGLEPFTLDHFRAWTRELVTDSGDPLELEGFQEDFVEDVFAGYRECWLVVPEGNGKTTILAALALYHCEHTLAAGVPVAASSREQAEIMYRQAEGFVLRTPRLRAEFRCQEGYRRIRHDRQGSRIQVFAADDRTGDGVIPTLCLVDELHRHRDLKLYRTWRGKLEKRGGQIVTISTAGEPGLEFELTRETIRKQGAGSGEFDREGCFTRAVSGRVVMHEWAVPEDADPEDLDLVKAANPFSGVTIEALAEKLDSPTMTLGHWRRFVCNLPTRSHAAAIQESEWYAARTNVEIPVGQSIWLGLDLGWKWDTTALVPLWWREETFRLFGPATVIVPPRDSSSLHPDEIHSALLTIHERNPIHTVVMDPTKGETTAAFIADELGAEVIDRPSSHTFAVENYNRFMEALRLGYLKHTGDVELTRHALNAVARVLPQGDARFERPSTVRQGGEQQIRVIDALDAAAMVHCVAAVVAEPRKPLVAFV